jgi:hypothetical protein
VSSITIRRRLIGFAVVAAAAAGAIAAVGALSAAWSTGSATAQNGAATTPPCATSHLAVWIGVGGGGGAAGSTYYPMEFTNVSSRACHLYGFPGVSASYAGRQAGSAATRDRSVAEHTVVLAPGASAHTVLRITDVANFPASACRPVTASGLTVYPPGQFASAAIPFRFGACRAKGPAFLSVQPVQPGIGVPGYPTL